MQVRMEGNSGQFGQEYCKLNSIFDSVTFNSPGPIGQEINTKGPLALLNRVLWSFSISGKRIVAMSLSLSQHDM
jgi:hypothetical protein